MNTKLSPFIAGAVALLLNACGLAVIAGSGRIASEQRAVSGYSQSITVNGSGDVNAAGLESQAASVTIVGSGDIQIWVNESLDIPITGSGNIDYRGKPRISQNVTGSGKIRSAPQQ
ncbi:MAG: DUF2807 domain-containing protein [Chloroflexota bacterium]